MYLSSNQTGPNLPFHIFGRIICRHFLHPIPLAVNTIAGHCKTPSSRGLTSNAPHHHVARRHSPRPKQKTVAAGFILNPRPTRASAAAHYGCIRPRQPAIGSSPTPRQTTARFILNPRRTRASVDTHRGYIHPRPAADARFRFIPNLRRTRDSSRRSPLLQPYDVSRLPVPLLILPHPSLKRPHYTRFVFGSTIDALRLSTKISSHKKVNQHLIYPT